MNNKIIYDSYRKQLISLHGLTILIVAIAEVVAYCLLVYQGKCKLSLFSDYLWLKVVFPIAVNCFGYIAITVINRYSIFKDNIKNSALVNISLLTAISISIFHREFVASFSAFIFPIFLSGIFNDKKHLNRSLFVSISFLLMNILLSKAETYTNLESIINYIAFFGIIVVAYLFGLISIHFYEFNFYIIQNQSMANASLRKRIKTDALTGLYNRDTMFVEIERAMELYKDESTPFCLAVLDVDNFKIINDLYGHNNGDIVLKKMAKILTEACNKNDYACRFGGDEFGIVFNDKTLEDAKLILINITEELANLTFAFTKQQISCSCGIAEYKSNMSSSDLFNEADINMYQAKHNGKDRIYC